MSDVTNAQLLAALEASTQASLKQAEEYSKLAAGLAVHGQRLESGQRSIDGLTTAIQGKDGNGGLVSHVAVIDARLAGIENMHGRVWVAITAGIGGLVTGLVALIKGGN